MKALLFTPHMHTYVRLCHSNIIIIIINNYIYLQLLGVLSALLLSYYMYLSSMIT